MSHTHDIILDDDIMDEPKQELDSKSNIQLVPSSIAHGSTDVILIDD